MARVYLETSFFSACVSTRTTPKSLGWRASSLEWWDTQRHRHDLHISPEVIDELSAESYPNRDAAIEMLQGLRVLEIAPEVQEFARLLVREHVMPSPAVSGDAIHIAAATLHRMEYVLTWNVQHLANPNKRTHFAVVCMRLGLAPPIIVTPDLLQEPSNEHD